MNSYDKNNFIGLIPLIIFLILYLSIGIITNNFNSMPLMIGIIIASIISIIIPNKDKKINIEKRINIFCKGGGQKDLILMVIIFLMAGGFYGIAKKMNAVNSVTNLGLSILPTRLILPGLFIIGCIISFAMGTSMGTVAALMPIAISLSLRTHSNILIFCGTVIGSAMFGDNLSMISASVIAANKTQNVNQNEKLKTNLLMIAPAWIFNIFLLSIYPIQNIKIYSSSYHYNIIDLFPYIIVIILSFSGLNVLSVLFFGIISGIIIGVYHGNFGIIQSMNIIHKGMLSMEDMALIAILVGGLVEVMGYLGGINWLLTALTKKVKNAKGGELAIACLVSLLDIITTNDTISIITAGPLAKDISNKYKIAPKRTASILTTFSCIFNGIIPYGGQLLVAGGLAKISPIKIVPYSWYCLLMLLSSTLFIIIKKNKVVN